MANSVPGSQLLEVGTEVAAVLRPEEAQRLLGLRHTDRVRCKVCRQWIEPGPGLPASVSVSLEDAQARVELAHVGCSPSRADLAPLVVQAQAEPLGIEYSQAMHPAVGAVLLWERKLDLRVRGFDGGEESLYLDPGWWTGFHYALPDEPVRLLAGWLLTAEEHDLVLCRAEREIERFHDAMRRAPARWLESLRESGFCLLIVGAGIGLERPGPAAIQRAIRERRALLGMVEFDL